MSTEEENEQGECGQISKIMVLKWDESPGAGISKRTQRSKEKVKTRRGGAGFEL